MVCHLVLLLLLPGGGVVLCGWCERIITVIVSRTLEAFMNVSDTASRGSFNSLTSSSSSTEPLSAALFTSANTLRPVGVFSCVSHQEGGPTVRGVENKVEGVGKGNSRAVTHLDSHVGAVGGEKDAAGVGGGGDRVAARVGRLRRALQQSHQ